MAQPITMQTQQYMKMALNNANIAATRVEQILQIQYANLIDSRKNVLTSDLE